MSEQDTLQVKLQQAKAAAQQPVRVTDVEFAVIMLRESFVAAQASDSLCPRLFCWLCLTPRCSLFFRPPLLGCSRICSQLPPSQRATIPNGSSS
jgi:hypothetical protein